MRAVKFATLSAIAGLALAGTAPAQDASLPEGPGKDLINKTCTACHAITQVTSVRRPKAQWADTVDQMIARGAPVSEEDYPAIVDYLAKNFSPAATPAAAPSAVPGAKSAK